MRVAPSDP